MYYKRFHQLEYSHSIWPLIILSIVINVGLVVAIFNLLRDVFANGIYVWHRNNLGSLLEKLFFHICLMCTLFKTETYITSKEERDWKPDIDGDK